MTVELPRTYTGNAEGPFDAFVRATADWTAEMQGSLRSALAAGKRRGPLLLGISFPCPSCGQKVDQFDQQTVTFYDEDDLYRSGDIVGEAWLVTIGPCGHTFRKLPAPTGTP